MQKCINNCPQDTTQNLKNIIACQNEKICKLKEKLETYDEVVTERDNLRTLVKDFEQWNEKHDANRKKMFTALLTSIEDQTNKLKQAATLECTWQVKYSELQNINDDMTNELKNVKFNERLLKSRLEFAEKRIKCIQSELCQVKLECAELEEYKCVIKKMKGNLKSNEEELNQKVKQIDDCTKECNQLKEMNELLELKLKCTKSKFDDTKLNKTCAEEKWKIERETLNSELGMKCKLLNEMEIKIYDDESKIKKLVEVLTILREQSSKNYNELNNRINKLKKEICAKKKDSCAS